LRILLLILVGWVLYAVDLSVDDPSPSPAIEANCKT
jgi:hypothetical protein